MRRAEGLTTARPAARRSGVGLGDVDVAAADAAAGEIRCRAGRATGDGVANERRLLQECCPWWRLMQARQGAGAAALMPALVGLARRPKKKRLATWISG